MQLLFRPAHCKHQVKLAAQNSIPVKGRGGCKQTQSVFRARQLTQNRWLELEGVDSTLVT